MKFKYLTVLLILFSCSTHYTKFENRKSYNSKGFAYIYNENDYELKVIKNKKKVVFFKKYIKNYENFKIDDKLMAAIIIPDKDIIPEAETLSPAYIIFENYEKILNWNRSLRFALAVCTLKNNFKNEI